ncbi:hypothetical protein ACFE04_021110 [Oxalis oulophora]
MGAFSHFFSRLYTITAVLFTLLLLEVIILVRSAAGTLNNYGLNNKRMITTSEYLEFIEEKNPTIQYKKGCLEAMQCTVCLSEYEEGERVRRLMKCKHTFHKECLDKWLQHYRAATCPLCRTKVLPDEIISSFHYQLLDNGDYDGSDEEIIFFLSALHRNTLYRFF